MWIQTTRAETSTDPNGKGEKVPVADEPVAMETTPTTPAYLKAKRSGEAKMSDYVMSGVWEGFTPPPLPAE